MKKVDELAAADVRARNRLADIITEAGFVDFDFDAHDAWLPLLFPAGKLPPSASDRKLV